MTIEERERLIQRRHPVFGATKAIVRLFVKRPRVLDLSSLGQMPALYLANHSSAAGPFKLELFLPRDFVFWGVHQMCGSFRERKHYLYHVFYRQKLKWSKGPAMLMAYLFGFIVGMFYRGAAVIPTYQDGRFRKTLEISVRAVGNGKSVVVFPENSQEGYYEMPVEYLAGFVLFARLYRKIRGEDLPICPLYYSKKSNTIIIGQPFYLGKIEEDLDAASVTDIAEYFRQRTSELCQIHAPACG